MRQVRNGLFETNSSSTHSLVINPDPNFTKNFNLVLDENGYIEVDGYDQFNDCVAYGFYEKLAYMLSWMYLRDNDDPSWVDNREELNDMVYPSDYFDSSYENEYSNILDVIRKYFPEVKGFVLKNVGDINWDHQTTPYESDFVISLWNETEIEGYLFNDNVKVVVGRD